MKKILCLLLLMASIVSCNAQEKQHVKRASPKEFSQMMAAKKGQVIDVRTTGEYKSGHLENALHLHIYDKDFEQRIDKLDKNEPVYIYCKAGGRSSEAVEILHKKGFKEIVELEGGIDAWQEAGKPVKQ